MFLTRACGPGLSKANYQTGGNSEELCAEESSGWLADSAGSCVLCEFLHVCAWRGTSGADWGVFFCLRVRHSRCPFSSRQRMSHGTCDSMLQSHFYLFIYLFIGPPETKKGPGHCRNMRRVKSDPELWSDLEPKQREKPCCESSSLVLND